MRKPTITRARMVAAGPLAPAAVATASIQHTPSRASLDTSDHPAVSAHPDLTANTPVPSNKTQRPGVARCFALVRTPADHTVTTAPACITANGCVTKDSEKGSAPCA